MPLSIFGDHYTKEKAMARAEGLGEELLGLLCPWRLGYPGLGWAILLRTHKRKSAQISEAQGFFVTSSDGLHPTSDGLQPTSDRNDFVIDQNFSFPSRLILLRPPSQSQKPRRATARE